MRIRRTRQLYSVLAAVAVAAGMTSIAPAEALGGDAEVSIGSPSTPYIRNAQNEPTVAIDANNTLVAAAGANDLIDMAPCNGSSCDLTPDIGLSGIYFSFDGGSTWTQPEYDGLNARSGVTQPGPIGTLPNYFENGLSSHGDPSLAFGPRPGPDGFSWTNGSRLYYANIAFNLSTAPAFKGFAAIAVSRTDDVAGAAAGVNSAWLDPVIVSKQSSATFSDKETLWADNAASSAFFGNVYICNVAFRSNGSLPDPVMVARSTDGGDTWTQRQISQAANTGVAAGQAGGRQGCTVRTDSEGVVYVFWEGSLNGAGVQFLARSFDGGVSFERPRAVASVSDCGAFDPVSGRVTFDGIAGARTDSFPIADVANGAPTGDDATDEVVLSWCDGANGLGHEQALVAYSTNQGQTWPAPVNLAEAGDRPDFPSVAISPDGADLYVTYDAFLQTWQTTTASPRLALGVVRHAEIGAGGTPTAASTLHRGVIGDARASSRTLNREAVYDYVGVAATNDVAAAVWMDLRNAEVCPAVNAYRQSLLTGPALAAPSPATDCPETFGNLDIYGGAYGDPT
jgi:hypothetical protein